MLALLPRPESQCVNLEKLTEVVRFGTDRAVYERNKPFMMQCPKCPPDWNMPHSLGASTITWWKGEVRTICLIELGLPVVSGEDLPTTKTEGRARLEWLCVCLHLASGSSAYDHFPVSLWSKPHERREEHGGGTIFDKHEECGPCRVVDSTVSKQIGWCRTRISCFGVSISNGLSS
jgi:hypothetical protein